jgi:DNA-binding transcriptional regulator YiaG
MTKSSLKARFARLGPILDVPRKFHFDFDDGIVLVLRPLNDNAGVKAVSATRLLAGAGLSVLRAKHGIESMLEVGDTAVIMPTEVDTAALARELRTAGIKVTQISGAPVDVQATRNRLGMTQDQFALRYGLDLAAVRNWEQGRRRPNRTTSAYLRVIARLPEEAGRAQEEDPLKRTPKEATVRARAAPKS